jgi:hypothetical protein
MSETEVRTRYAAWNPQMKVRDGGNGDNSSRSGEPGRKRDDDLFF